MKKICSFNREKSSQGVQAPRVIADGSRVLGMNVNASSETSNLVRWETNMKVEVSKLATTNNGDVVAVMTNDQSLSILRGMDGATLVSRNIEAKGHDEGDQMILEKCISFISNKSMNDVLIVPYLVQRHDGENRNTKIKILTVLGIDGDALNSNNQETKGKALSQLSTKTITIHLPNQLDNENVVQVRGVMCPDGSTIRFMVASKKGQIFVYDYDTTNFNSTIIENHKIIDLDDKDESWTLDLDSGMHIDNQNSQILVMNLVARSANGWIKNFWIDFTTFDVICEYELSSAHDDAVILSSCSLKPATNNTIATGIALQNPLNKCVYVLVIQCALMMISNEESKETKMPIDIREKIALQNPHLVFNTLVHVDFKEKDSPLLGAEAMLCSMQDEYNFCLLMVVHNCVQWWTFETSATKSIGYVKAALAFCDNIDSSEVQMKLQNDFKSNGSNESMFQIESSLWTFKKMMKQEKILTSRTKDQVREIFRLLTTGAVTGGQHGVQNLIEASEALRDWPRQKNHANNNGPQLRDFYLVLNAMKINVSNAIKGTSQSSLHLLESEVKRLDEKIACMKCLETVLKIGKKEEIPVGTLGQLPNIVQLFRKLLLIGAFEVAERVRKYDNGKYINCGELAESINDISAKLNPKIYCTWLENVAIPILVFNQEKLDIVKRWCCKTADYFDRKDGWGIDASILLLETISDSVVNATVEKHASFASCPSLGRQKRNEDLDSTCGIMATKLQQAQVLKQARAFGLPQHLIDLSSYKSQGAADFISKGLLRILCESYGVDEFITSSVKENVRLFIQKTGVSFDDAIVKYAEELCDNDAQNGLNLELSFKMTKLCSDPGMKSQIALKVLHNAHFSKISPDVFCFRSVTSDALKWARSDSTKTELQEISRLLEIDDIVRRYCGKKCLSCFSVHVSHHSSNLLKFVCRYIDVPTQVEDILYLCDSFTNLSKEDAIFSILQKISSAPEQILNNRRSRSKQCGLIITKILSTDARLAKIISLRFFSYADELLQYLCNLDYCSDEDNSLYRKICSAGISVGSAILTSLSRCDDSDDLFKVKCLTAMLERMQRLNDNFSVLTSFPDFESCQRIQTISISIIEHVITSWLRLENKMDHAFNTFFKKAKLGVSVLCCDKPALFSAQWCKAIAKVASIESCKGNEELCLKVLEGSGILNEIQNEHAYKAVISIVTSLCPDPINTGSISGEALLRSMQSFFLAVSLLQEHVLKLCPPSLLPIVVFLNNATNLISDIILRTDSGYGEKVKEFQNHLIEKYKAHKYGIQNNKITKFSTQQSDLKTALSLHPDWYVGDGLLLPPAEALAHSMRFLQEVLIQSCLLYQKNDHSCINGLFQFLHTHGALSILLKTQAFTYTVIQTSIKTGSDAQGVVSSFNQISHDAAHSLTERYLASAGSGNTNGIIDPDLGLYHLLSLPIKVAFKSFKRCLPSAMAEGNFDRLVMLANLGLRATEYGSKCNDDIDTFYWRNQTKFAAQCQDLFQKSRWFQILKALNISFDPNCFVGISQNDKKALCDKGLNDQIVDVLTKLIQQASKYCSNKQFVTDLCADFARSFKINESIAIEKQIEYLLLLHDTLQPASIQSLSRSHTFVSNLLENIPSCIQRITSLRRSLISFEAEEENGRDFNRYRNILSLYQKEIKYYIEESSTGCNALYNKELDRINRRQDALAIVSSFFEGKQKSERPAIQNCFVPLSDTRDLQTCGVLGIQDQDDDIKDTFDPLIPLCHFLLDSNVVSALAPLCLPLGLPTGFVHARSLVIKLGNHSDSDILFERDIVPVVRRLKTPKHGAELAEWCALRFPRDSLQRLKCLELAHTLAIRASTEVEYQLLQQANSTNISNESAALETVKRITLSKSILADEVLVADSLTQFLNTRNFPLNSTVFSRILQEVKQLQDMDPTPENYVENLYVVGSLIAAEASLNRTEGLSDESFFTLSLAIQHANKKLEEQYTHINLKNVAGFLVKKWLLHGDEMMTSTMKETSMGVKRMDISTNDDTMMIDEEETSEFVLDMKAITSSKDIWSEGLGSCIQNQNRKVVADEEQSSLEPSCFGREASELKIARTGLRIAFILNGLDEGSERTSQVEYLLQLVFARKSLNADGILKDISMNTFMESSGLMKAVDKMATRDIIPSGKALTFVMRYRALRALLVLCHESDLEGMIIAGNFFKNEKCSLTKCCYGLLLAKEIESMRLSLPHSDLEQLSMMHHPTYARTLWSNYRYNTLTQFRGRFLLLLLELSLKETIKSIDTSFVKMLLREISASELPRTMLLCCESISQTNNLESLFHCDEELVGMILLLSRKVAGFIVNDINDKNESIDLNNIVSTILRLGKSIQLYVSNGARSSEIVLFVEILCRIGEKYESKNASSNNIFQTAISIALKLKDNMREEAFSIIQRSKTGNTILAEKHKGKGNDCSHLFDNQRRDQRDCLFEKIVQIEGGII